MRRLLVLLPLSLLLAACGTSGKSTSSPSGGPVLRTITDLGEGALTHSEQDHGRQDGHLRAEGDEQRHDHPRLEIEGNGVEEKTGDVAPGSTATLRVNLSKDRSCAIYCPIDGHRGQGMAGTLAVGNGSSSGGMTTGETTTSGGPGY